MIIIGGHPNAGRKQSPEHIAKRVESARKTKNAWTEEQRALALVHQSEAHKGYVFPEERKIHMSQIMRGKRNSLGTKRSPEFRKRLSEYWKDNPNHNHYVDGLGAERNGQREKEMSRLEYRTWRETVLKRDSYTCQECGKVGGMLHADHKKPYSIFPELRLDVDNGRTLCVPCHKKTDTYAWKMAHKIRRHGGSEPCRAAFT